MIRHVPRSFKLRVAQSKSSKEMFSLVTLAPTTEFADPLTVSVVYSQFGKLHKHKKLPQEQTSQVLQRLGLLERPFPTPSSLVHVCVFKEAFSLVQRMNSVLMF
jgi:hypothetical protein